MNFKKKKEVAEVKSKVEEQVEPKTSAKRVPKAKEGSYLDRMNSKMEVSSKKDVSRVFVKSERQEPANAKSEPAITKSEVVSVKKSAIVVPTSKKAKPLDLRIESLRTVMKPPQTILSMIEDEYDDIVSTQNVVLSTRSIRASKRDSFAESAHSESKKLGESALSKKPSISTQGYREDTQSTSAKADNSPKTKLVEGNNNGVTHGHVVEQKVRSSEPSKFLRFSEFDNTNDDAARRVTSYHDHRLTFQGTPTSDAKFVPIAELPTHQYTEHIEEDEESEEAEPTDFTDIFTPKGVREPVESLPRAQSLQRDEFEPDIFVKKVHSKENMLESLQQAAFLEKKGVKIMDTQALFESERMPESEHDIGSNVFNDPSIYIPKTFDHPISAKFNHVLDADYITSNFQPQSNVESEKELLQNINNLIEQNYAEEGGDAYRHKRPLHATSFNKSEDDIGVSVYVPQHADISGSDLLPNEPERMKRVITFANVHKLAKPTAEDEEFIRNYYANKDYPKAISDDEEDENQEVSKDSLDVPEPSRRTNEEGGFSVKSDRFHDEVGESRSVRFQSVTTSKLAAESKGEAGRPSGNVVQPVAPVNIKTSNALNFAQWEMNYVSKDTQEIDNNLLAEINAIYKNTSKVKEDAHASEDSDNDKLNNTDRNMFLVANKDQSFDEEDKPSAFAIAPETEYFTLGNMAMQHNKVQSVDALTLQMEKKLSEFNNNNTLVHGRPQLKQQSTDSLDDKAFEERASEDELSDEVVSAKPAFRKRDSTEFEDKFNELIIKMLNKKATIIQRFWRETRPEKPRDLVLADLFREFVKIKRRNENFVRKNCDMKGVQTSNYSIKIIQKEFVAYLDEVLDEAPNAAELMQLVGDLGLLLKKLGISGN